MLVITVGTKRPKTYLYSYVEIISNYVHTPFQRNCNYVLLTQSKPLETARNARGYYYVRIMTNDIKIITKCVLLTHND